MKPKTKRRKTKPAEIITVDALPCLFCNRVGTHAFGDHLECERQQAVREPPREPEVRLQRARELEAWLNDPKIGARERCYAPGYDEPEGNARFK